MHKLDKILANNSEQKYFSIKDVLSSSGNRISLELSPNSDFDPELLNELNPRFISVTWLGTTHLELPANGIPAIILAQKLCDKGYPVLLHLAGRNLNKQRMLENLNHFKDVGIKNILALQGDPVDVVEKDDAKCDFPYAASLVSFIKQNFGDQFCVGVAAYPDSNNVQSDVKFLQQKVSAGADFIITQACFEYEILEKFAQTCKDNNINVPVLPGIYTIKSYKSSISFAKMCGLQVPKNILEFLKRNQNNGDVMENYGLDLARNLIVKIFASKNLFAEVHIFSMNDMDLVAKVVRRLENLNIST